MFAEYM